MEWCVTVCLCGVRHVRNNAAVCFGQLFCKFLNKVVKESVDERVLAFDASVTGSASEDGASARGD